MNECRVQLENLKFIHVLKFQQLNNPFDKIEIASLIFAGKLRMNSLFSCIVSEFKRGAAMVANYLAKTQTG